MAVVLRGIFCWDSGDIMIKKTSDGPLTRVRIIDGFDVFIVLVAVVALALNFTSRIKSNPNRLSGITGYMTKNRIEKKLSKISGIKSAELEFSENYGQYSVTALITPLAGNYSIYSDETLEKIYAAIMEETGIPENYIMIFDSDTGQRIEKSGIRENGGSDRRIEGLYEMFGQFFGI